MKNITLTQGKTTLVDDADYEWLNQWKWCAVHINRYWYASRTEGFRGQYISMHRLIIGVPQGLLFDHLNNNGLDNQRHNLRICTQAENTHNQMRQQRNKSSKFKGVYWHKPTNKWRAIIKINMKRLYLGNYTHEKDAAIAYNKAAIKCHGEFAKLNQV